MSTFTLICLIITGICLLWSVAAIIFGAIKNTIAKKKIKKELDNKYGKEEE